METTHRRSIFWPLLLITIGVIFLLNTIGFIQGDGWELFLKLWPLLFIIGGLDNIFQGRGYVWAVISLGLGTVFLLANFGYLPWNSLSLLLRFWPLLLIGAGLDLIFRGRSPVATVVGVLLAVLVVGGIVWFALSGTTFAQRESSPISQALDSAKRLDVEITNPAAQLDLHVSSGQRMAVQGEVVLGPSESIDQSYAVRNGTGELRLESSGTVFLPWAGGLSQPSWEIHITDAVPVTLRATTAAGGQHIDLRGLEIEGLDLTVAVGELNLTLPEEGKFDGKLSNPVGMIRVTVPAGALVEFQVDGVFLAKSIPAGFTVNGNRIYSLGADSRNATMRIKIEQPIGRLVLAEMP